VAVTAGILEILTWQELRAVLAHELSHVANRDILIGSVAAAVATGITFVANMALWGQAFGGSQDDQDSPNPVAVIALAILAPVAAGLLQMAVSRSREFQADRAGADLIGNGEPLATALLKLDQTAKQIPMAVQPARASMYIVNPITGRQIRFANLYLTHPPTADRVAQLRARRPAPDDDKRAWRCERSWFWWRCLSAPSLEWRERSPGTSTAAYSKPPGLTRFEVVETQSRDSMCGQGISPRGRSSRHDLSAAQDGERGHVSLVRLPACFGTAARPRSRRSDLGRRLGRKRPR
jgi:hypothetical protein